MRKNKLYLIGNNSNYWSDTTKATIVKVHVIQKWSKLFFLKYFIWFDSARRALQKCIWKKQF